METVRDTGCDTVIVRTGLVRADQFTGETMRCAMMNGRIVKAPVAKINVSTPHLCGEVEALCFKEALYDLVIGNVPKAREPYRPDPEWGKGMVEGEYRSQTERINGDRRASEVVKLGEGVRTQEVVKMKVGQGQVRNPEEEQTVKVKEGERAGGEEDKTESEEKKVNNKSRPRDKESDREVGHRGQEEVLMLVLEEVKGVADRLSKDDSKVETARLERGQERELKRRAEYKVT